LRTDLFRATALVVGLLAAASSARGGTWTTAPAQPTSVEIPLAVRDGVHVALATVNGTTTLPFIVDSGAAGVTIPYALK
jgi:hypothetical protein